MVLPELTAGLMVLALLILTNEISASRVHLNRALPECQITNKVNKERDKRKHRSHEKITQAN